MEEEGTQVSFLAPSEVAREVSRRKLMELMEENLLLMREIGVLYGLPKAEEDRRTIKGPADVAELLMAEMSPLEQEQMKVVLLDVRKRLLGVEMVYQGSVHTTMVRMGEVFKEAVRCNASAVVLVHNHPSGSTSPSPQDLRLTHAAVEAGDLLSIEVVDHLIIGGGDYMSLKGTHGEEWE